MISLPPEGLGSGDDPIAPDVPRYPTLDNPGVFVRTPEDLVRDLLELLGEDPERSGLKETPRRFVAALFELLTPVEFEYTTFEDPDRNDEMIVVKDIPFFSLCEHHVLPFAGTAHVGYIPNGETGRILGLSKIARCVEFFARNLQLQERLTTQIAAKIEEVTEARGVGVVLDAEHFCMTMRGVKKPGSTTRTSALRGVFRETEVRAEFLHLINNTR